MTTIGRNINEVYTERPGGCVDGLHQERPWQLPDLQSFSNDPRELLAAYRGAANAALNAVVESRRHRGDRRRCPELSCTGTSHAGQPDHYWRRHRTRHAAAGLSAQELHARASAKLPIRRQQFADRAQALQAQLTAAGTEVQGLEEKVTADEPGSRGEAGSTRRRRIPPATCTPPDDAAARDKQLQDARTQLVADQTAKSEAEKKRDVWRCG